MNPLENQTSNTPNAAAPSNIPEAPIPASAASVTIMPSTPAPAPTPTAPAVVPHTPFTGAVANAANAAAGKLVSPFANISSNVQIPTPAANPSVEQIAKDALAKISETSASAPAANPESTTDATDEPNNVPVETSDEKTEAEAPKTRNRIQNDAKYKPTIGKKRISPKQLKRIGIIAGASVAALLVIIFVVKLISIVPSSKHKLAPFDTNLVVVRQRKNGGSYGLFRKIDGAQISDFEYQSVSQFIDGYALAVNALGQYGVIDDEGQVSIPFGEYATITTAGGAYSATIKDSKTVKILLGSGKQIAKIENSAGGNLISNTNAPFFAFTKDGKNYTLYSARGDKVKSFESGARPFFESSSSKEIAFLRYGEHVVVLDCNNYKIITEADYSDSYSFSTASFDKRYIILKNREQKTLLLTPDGTHDHSDNCKMLNLLSDSNKGQNVLICKTKDGTEKIIGENGELTDKETNYQTQFYTPQDYIYRNDKGTVEIRHNGEIVRTIENVSSSSLMGVGYSVVYNSDTGVKNVYVSRDGKDLFEIDANRRLTDVIGGGLYLISAENNESLVIDQNEEAKASVDSGSFSFKWVCPTVAAGVNKNEGKRYLFSTSGQVKEISYGKNTFSADSGVECLENGNVLIRETNGYSYLAPDLSPIVSEIPGSQYSYKEGFLRFANGGQTELYSENGTKFHTWQ